MRTLYLIDGYAQFFRAYHAIRTPMTSPVTKEPTNATYGFVGMLLKVFAELRPDYLAVAIDVSGDKETFRSQLYPDYKATRSEPPEDFRPQAQRCIDILRALNIPVLGAEGFEADDVIATVAHRIGDETPGVRVRIVSKDKDLQQLLTPTDDDIGGVEMYDVHTDELIDVKALAEAKHVTPEQVVDMLALMGDTVDNVPGVEGVGPKTAAKLIEEFGTLEAVVDEATADKPKKDWKIKGKRRENIAAAADRLPLAKQLVTLRRDTPIEFDLDAASVRRFDMPRLQPLLNELGFTRYQDELKKLLTGEPAGQKQSAAAKSGGSASPAGDGPGLFDASAEELEAEPLEIEVETVTTKKQLRALVAALQGAELVAVDTETDAISAMRASLVGLSFAVDHTRGWYVPVRSPDPSAHLDEAAVLDALRPVLEDDSIKKTGHNLKYDLLVLRHGVDTPVELRGIACDTMVASYLIDASRSSHGMDALALAELGYTCISIRELLGTGKSQKCFDEVPLDRAAPYAAEDAVVSLRLHDALMPRLREMQLDALFNDVELPLVRVLAELEYNGIRVDPDELDRQRDKLAARIDDLRSDIIESLRSALGPTAWPEFNPDSPKQLAAVLFNKPDAEPAGLGVKPIKRTKTGYSTDAETLEKLAADPDVDTPIPALIVEYRQLTKLVSTYLVALKDAIHPETKRIHASFNQTVAATGRLSSSDPNLQNIPIRTPIGREIRRAFVAEPGCLLVSADYSQIELRLLAHLAEEENLIAAFNRGDDIHRSVAAEIHDVELDDVTSEQRSGAKMVNFGIVYGITPFGLARRLGVETAEAAEIIAGYKQRFPGIDAFLARCVDDAHRQGYVTTILDRRRPIPDIDSRTPARRALAERMAINSVVQGSAADLIKLAMVEVQRLIDAGEIPARMLLQIHDELVFECNADDAETVEARVRGAMEGCLELSTPLIVDVERGASWYGDGG